MDNFNLKKYLSENKLKEESVPSQFGSESAKRLAIAKADLSNAILSLDSNNPYSRKKAEDAYSLLGIALEDHLEEKFGG